MTITFPRREELSAFAQANAIPYTDVVRDVVRLAAVAHLRETNFLHRDLVLVGGMALRLRGSNRFTIFDTDSSTRTPPTEESKLTAALTLQTDDLEIIPENPDYWLTRNQIVTAKPVTYKAYFAGTATKPIEDEFSLTVNERGLELAPDWLKLHVPDYPGLIFHPMPDIPVMALDEQTAEKIMGWCGNSLAKHYVDLGWIGRELTDKLDSEILRAMCERKLEVNRGIFPGYEALDSVGDLIAPLRDPESYFGPNNYEKDIKAGGLRFVGNGMSLDEAKAYVRERIVPLLEAGDSAPPGGAQTRAR
ncbi:MAG TPA: nucleotidyl transferase AbiEii/AbiGii toxin family protein [Solirubrobacterales bacterium]|nr:nucleotidyl transferase AbiEii/AbiGii toxin family protein [Solirubrobacterales bacterium]